MEHSQQVREATVRTDAPSVRVVARREGGQVVVLVHGEADVHTGGDLRSALMSALDGSPDAVHVDLGDLEFCGLAGSDALHEFADEAAARDIPVHFDGMSALLRMLYTRFPPGRSASQRDGGSATAAEV